MWRHSLRPHNRFGSRGAGKAKARYVKGVMNANEERFAKVLDEWKANGRILHYGFEELTFKLAPKTTYTPDFYVVQDDLQVVLYEVKSGQKTGKYFAIGDAGIKMKMCAEKFKHFALIVTWDHKTYARKYQEVGAHGADDNAADTEE